MAGSPRTKSQSEAAVLGLVYQKTDFVYEHSVLSSWLQPSGSPSCSYRTHCANEETNSNATHAFRWMVLIWMRILRQLRAFTRLQYREHDPADTCPNELRQARKSRL